MFKKFKGYQKRIGLLFVRDENLERKLINSIQLYSGIKRE